MATTSSVRMMPAPLGGKKQCALPQLLRPAVGLVVSAVVAAGCKVDALETFLRRAPKAFIESVEIVDSPLSLDILRQLGRLRSLKRLTFHHVKWEPGWLLPAQVRRACRHIRVDEVLHLACPGHAPPPVGTGAGGGSYRRH